MSYASWHAGNGVWRNKTGINAKSVGIEIVNLGTNHPDYNDCYPVEDKAPASDCKNYQFTEQQKASLLALIPAIKAKFPKMQNRQVLSHADIGFIDNHRIDPGPLFPIWEQMAKLGVGLYP